MPDALVPMSVSPSALGPEHLNQSCFCIALDRGDLTRELETASGDPEFYDRIATDQPHMFSNVPVFLRAATLLAMKDIVAAIEAVAQ